MNNAWRHPPRARRIPWIEKACAAAFAVALWAAIVGLGLTAYTAFTNAAFEAASYEELR